MSDNIRSMFVGKDEADRLDSHNAKLRKQREDRGAMINAFLAVLILVLCILIIVSAFVGSIVLIKSAF